MTSLADAVLRLVLTSASGKYAIAFTPSVLEVRGIRAALAPTNDWEYAQIGGQLRALVDATEVAIAQLVDHAKAVSTGRIDRPLWRDVILYLLRAMRIPSMEDGHEALVLPQEVLDATLLAVVKGVPRGALSIQFLVLAAVCNFAACGFVARGRIGDYAAFMAAKHWPECGAGLSKRYENVHSVLAPPPKWFIAAMKLLRRKVGEDATATTNPPVSVDGEVAGSLMGQTGGEVLVEGSGQTQDAS